MVSSPLRLHQAGRCRANGPQLVDERGLCTQERRSGEGADAWRQAHFPDHESSEQTGDLEVASDHGVTTNLLDEPASASDAADGGRRAADDGRRADTDERGADAADDGRRAATFASGPLDI